MPSRPCRKPAAIKTAPPPMANWRIPPVDPRLPPGRGYFGRTRSQRVVICGNVSAQSGATASRVLALGDEPLISAVDEGQVSVSGGTEREIGASFERGDGASGGDEPPRRADPAQLGTRRFARSEGEAGCGVTWRSRAAAARDGSSVRDAVSCWATAESVAARLCAATTGCPARAVKAVGRSCGRSWSGAWGREQQVTSDPAA
jgi:hypothetical protein